MSTDIPLYGETTVKIFKDTELDNTNQELHYQAYTYSGLIGEKVTPFIFKKGDYANTFIVVKVEGVPDGATLYLIDENSNPLYSPVDTNGNWITTRCSITVGQNDIIPLPAQFSNDLSTHTSFPAGTYEWGLRYPGNDTYYSTDIPLSVEIRDFKVWEVVEPEILPTDDIQVQLKTYGDTNYPDLISYDNADCVYDLSYVLTPNATYDPETGIITYPNSDIDDLSVGKHTQIISQEHNCTIDYEVINPS